ncbi:hypothetical protein CIPAW_05G098700 [Carya illinoinensis]|uniref:Uncharacterized protein n=1 Tax=Carya illinoinensis TaxID=32201 RepID=A0A8T1QHI8_CARIL|nr:hypothetical protein CIPAW_05G098700 [Carya illinoinensis]
MAVPSPKFQVLPSLSSTQRLNPDCTTVFLLLFLPAKNPTAPSFQQLF